MKEHFAGVEAAALAALGRRAALSYVSARRVGHGVDVASVIVNRG